MRFAVIFVAAFLAGCWQDEAAAPPAPVDLTADAVSHFCQMTVLEHGGPKGQIHLEGYSQPLFFAQVRDIIAYLKAPERDARIIAVYVTDTGLLTDWNGAGTGDWIAAADARFVVGSGIAGGMGAPEIIPFADVAMAQSFARDHGGTAVALDAIPDAAALAPVDPAQPLKEFPI